MKYLLLIYENEGNFATVSEEDGNRIFAEYMDYTRGIKKAGNYIGGEALQPVATATTVRQRNGKTLTTDGPFAETKEQLGGYYLIDVPDLTTALKYAALCPGARYGGCCEVRPLGIITDTEGGIAMMQ